MIKEAMLYEKLEDNKVHCYLCAHQCRMLPSSFGICGVRQNIEGTLNTLVYGEAIAANIDPIEKKPLYHFLPGTGSYSIATIGCNFKCGFCQNWQISQVSKTEGITGGRRLMPQEIVQEAKLEDCQSIAYTYTEPTIFFEYAYDTAKLAKEAGLKNVFVTNGYMSKEALETINPYLDAANVDLKSFRDEFYSEICKGRLQPVLDSIKLMKELGIWVEVTTLVVPGQNDSREELKDIAQFIASTGKEIPWHISRFHPNYKFLDQEATPVKTLKMAFEIGKEAGLKFVYLGNVLEGNDTFCCECSKLLVKRDYFAVTQNHIKDGKCSFCGAVIEGVF
jgi:pyruvate formate lyase activating enzyme